MVTAKLGKDTAGEEHPKAFRELLERPRRSERMLTGMYLVPLISRLVRK